MSSHYQAVGWNRQKRVYDVALGSGILLYLVAFVGLGSLLRPNASAEILLIRGLGTAAFLLLHVILSIGPLARLDRRFLPWLYNRRHLGVSMFVLALAHGTISVIQFHAFGKLNPLVSLLSRPGPTADLARFPFQPLGLLGLVILFLMAATSHDFWLANLTAPVWKNLHMLAYMAYGLLVLHVGLGVLQAERHPGLALLVTTGAIWIFGVHALAAWRERKVDRDRSMDSPDIDGFVAVCRVGEIPERRARIISMAGERVAVFRYDGKVSAVSNVCQHQNGPLGEGKIIDGCITCPWHGYQYDPASGASPAPFTEKVPTFDVRLSDGVVWVHPDPHPAGTRIEPAKDATP